MPRYKIQPGDTLIKIAKKLGVSVQHLIDENNIEDPNKIYAYDYLYY